MKKSHLSGKLTGIKMSNRFDKVSNRAYCFVHFNFNSLYFGTDYIIGYFSIGLCQACGKFR